MEVLKKGQKGDKKPTNAQLSRRIQNAVVIVEKDKDTKSIRFDDKGVRLTITMDYAVIETGFHRHVFSAITSSGVSRPYLYTRQFIDIALENDCMVTNDKGEQYRSYAKLFEVLKEKEDKTQYNIATYFDWWAFIIFDGLYSIGEGEASSWIVYFKYMCSIATNHILLEEHKEDVSNKQFVKRFVDLINEFTNGIDEITILHALSDEERMKEEIEALQKDADEKFMEEQANGLQQEQ
jgi:hypothetical protein